MPVGIAGVCGGHLGGCIADRLIAVDLDGAGELIGGGKAVDVGTYLRDVPGEMACVSEIRTYSPLPRHVHHIAEAPAIALRRPRSSHTTYGSCLKMRGVRSGCG